MEGVDGNVCNWFRYTLSQQKWATLIKVWIWRTETETGKKSKVVLGLYDHYETQTPKDESKVTVEGGW